MAKHKKTCLRCGTPFETDSARRLYCYGSCSYEVMLERRPVNNRRRREREKNREKFAKMLYKSPLAEANAKARAAGMTYGQYEAWQRCQEEIAIRQEERKRGIRFLDRFIIREECNNGELQQGAESV